MKNKLNGKKIIKSSMSFKVLCVAFAIALVSLMIPHNAFAYTSKNTKGGETGAPNQTATATITSTDENHDEFYWSKTVDGIEVDEYIDVNLIIRFNTPAVAYIDDTNRLVISYEEDYSEIEYTIFADGLYYGCLADEWFLNGKPIHDETSLTANSIFTVNYKPVEYVPMRLTGGDGHDSFYYKGYVNDYLMAEKEKLYIDDYALIGAEITLDPSGIISVIKDYYKELKIDVVIKNEMTIIPDYGYEFAGLTINGKDFKPGDKYIVQKDTPVDMYISYKPIDSPTPVPAPDKPEKSVNVSSTSPQTGDSIPFTFIAILAISAASASIVLINKKRFCK